MKSHLSELRHEYNKRQEWLEEYIVERKTKQLYAAKNKCALRLQSWMRGLTVRKNIEIKKKARKLKSRKSKKLKGRKMKNK